jgi:tetratricopeptide (TPR) repeat protein
MFLRCPRRSVFLILLLLPGAILYGAIQTKATDSTPLQKRYSEAQKLQRAGKLAEAAEQYRAFLGGALGELALGYSVARDYAHAAPLFDEALILEPNSPSLLLDYARTALALGNSEHARTLAAEFIQKYPGDRAGLAEAHQLLGRALLKLDRDQEARKELETALALDPTFANGYDLAVACLDMSDERCATQIFGEMEKSFGDTPEIHMAFGRAYSESDFQPRAVAEFQQAIAENPRLPGTHYLLATVLLATGSDEARVQQAEAALKQELVISPKDSGSYAALGKIALTRNHDSEAEAYLKKAAELAPENPDAYLYLGQLYFEKNSFAEAETALRECIRLTTDESRNRYQVQKAHFLLGRILMMRHQQDAAHAEMVVARELANKTLSQDKSKMAGLLDTAAGQDVAASVSRPPAEIGIDPSSLHRVEAMRERFAPALADSYNNLGAITATSGHYKDAVSYFERAAVWNPSVDGLDYNWGRTAFAGSEFREAIPPLSRYVKAHPDDSGARSVLAISSFMAGSYQNCIDALQPVIGKAELVPQVQYVYAESLVKTGQTAAGMERLEALAKLHPEIPDVHRSLGEALIVQGQKQRAVEELRAAIGLSPRDAESHYDLGKLELEGGQTATAIPELEAAVRLTPNSESFHQELAIAYRAGSRTSDAQKEIEICAALRAHSSSLH